MSIWFGTPTLAMLNEIGGRTITSQLGIKITEIGADFLRGTMPVDHRTHQPFGLLHGGASVVLAETLGSLAATLTVDSPRTYCVGLEINANHMRPVRDGVVTGTARPEHIGKTTQVWTIRIRNEADKLVCVSRITMAVRSNER